jgi:hypothetical protein
VVAAARELAGIQKRSLGSVVSELARRRLTPAQVETESDIPVIRVPEGSPPITESGFVRVSSNPEVMDAHLLTLSGGHGVNLLKAL